MRSLLVVAALAALCSLGMLAPDKVANGQSCGGAAASSCSGAVAASSCSGSVRAAGLLGARRGIVRRVVSAPVRMTARLVSPRCGG
jgi:hypothetical protein